MTTSKLLKAHFGKLWMDHQNSKSEGWPVTRAINSSTFIKQIINLICSYPGNVILRF